MATQDNQASLNTATHQRDNAMPRDHSKGQPLVGNVLPKLAERYHIHLGHLGVNTCDCRAARSSGSRAFMGGPRRWYILPNSSKADDRTW